MTAHQLTVPAAHLEPGDTLHWRRRQPVILSAPTLDGGWVNLDTSGGDIRLPVDTIVTITRYDGVTICR